MMRQISIIIILVLVLPMQITNSSGGEGSSLPVEWMVDVPYYSQETDTTCTIATVEMLLDYYGPHVVQEEISSVAQQGTQEGAGSNAAHARRAGHFSHLSRARHDPTLQGYTAREIGYAAFVYQWSTGGDVDVEEVAGELKTLLYQDFPILVITWYDEENDQGGATHARILRGYSDVDSTFTLHDPWLGDGKYNGPDMVVDQEFFINRLWNVNGYRTATIMYPWHIQTDIRNVEERTFILETTVHYPCPNPFDELESYPASDSQIHISLPPGLELSNGSQTVNLGTISQGDAREVTWELVAGEGKVDGTIEIYASGLVTGYTLSPKGSNYVYVDEIGGEASISFYLDAAETGNDGGNGENGDKDHLDEKIPDGEYSNDDAEEEPYGEEEGGIDSSKNFLNNLGAFSFPILLLAVMLIFTGVVLKGFRRKH